MNTVFQTILHQSTIVIKGKIEGGKGIFFSGLSPVKTSLHKKIICTFDFPLVSTLG